MLGTLKKSTLALPLACLLLGLEAAAVQAPAAQSPGTRSPATRSASAQSPIFAGPGGRTSLLRWTLRSDPSGRGLALGCARGGFGGRTVSLPNDVNPVSYSGPAGARNYEGSQAWYRTSFTA